jgi:hypothetical protein
LVQRYGFKQLEKHGIWDHQFEDQIIKALGLWELHLEALKKHTEEILAKAETIEDDTDFLMLIIPYEGNPDVNLEKIERSFFWHWGFWWTAVFEGHGHGKDWFDVGFIIKPGRRRAFVRMAETILKRNRIVRYRLGNRKETVLEAK